MNAVVETMRLRERVEAHDKDIVALQVLIRQTYTDLAAKLDSSITVINAKLDERARFPWPAAGIGFSAIIAIGGLAYWPINTEQVRLARDIDTISGQILGITDHFSIGLEKLNDKVVPRGEHEQRWSNFDIQMGAITHRIDLIAADINKLNEMKLSATEFNVQHGDLKALLTREIENLQREITDLQQASAATYNIRDALLEQRQRISDLERALRPVSDGGKQ